jgi:uncharacterized protein (TIGR02444 family)
MQTEEQEGAAFWRFSLRFYADAAVQRTLLALQDRCGADVNVLLYLLWRAGEGDVLDVDATAALDDAVRIWREAAVAPLRALRRRLKPLDFPVNRDGQQRLRETIKAAEIEAERLAQGSLAALNPPAADRAGPEEAARTSLAGYARHLGRAFPQTEVELLAGRLDALPRPS